MNFHLLPPLDPQSVIFEKSSQKQENANLFNAFAENDILTLTLKIPKAACAKNVELILQNDTTKTEQKIPLILKTTTFSNTIFILILNISDLTPHKTELFFYHFQVKGNGPKFFIYKGEDDEAIISENSQNIQNFQLLIYQKDFQTPNFMQGATMYQIFPDRFAISKNHKRINKPYEIINDNWENATPQYPKKRGDPIDNIEFFGGSIYAIAEKLDYIKDLGANIIYLNPIFTARSNHKYDTADYESVDIGFGGDIALNSLIKEAHKRNMHIILDGVWAHTGDDSRYFNKYGIFNEIGAYQSQSSPYYNWYSFEQYPNKYRCWWGIDILPTLSHNEPSMQEYLLKIAEKWIKTGISGWRIDVADELSDTFLKNLRTRVKKANKNALLLGEVWEDASNKISYNTRRAYLQGEELDSIMNYPLREAIIHFVKTGDSTLLYKTTKNLYSNYPKCVSDANMNILSTHDTDRIISILSDRNTQGLSNYELANESLSKEERDIATTRLKSALKLLFTLPGVPCIYYGDEIGMEGRADPFNRRPMKWEKVKNNEILNYIKELSKLRNSSPLFANGYFKCTNHDINLFEFVRFDKNNSITIKIQL